MLRIHVVNYFYGIRFEEESGSGRKERGRREKRQVQSNQHIKLLCSDGERRGERKKKNEF